LFEYSHRSRCQYVHVHAEAVLCAAACYVGMEVVSMFAIYSGRVPIALHSIEPEVASASAIAKVGEVFLRPNRPPSRHLRSNVRHLSVSSWDRVRSLRSDRRSFAHLKTWRKLCQRYKWLLYPAARSKRCTDLVRSQKRYTDLVRSQKKVHGPSSLAGGSSG
jgi:hypothetical protein